MALRALWSAVLLGVTLVGSVGGCDAQTRNRAASEATQLRFGVERAYAEFGKCPDDLAALAAAGYSGPVTDPWGEPYGFTCETPASSAEYEADDPLAGIEDQPRISARSRGPDRKPDTSDDIVSQKG